jgi:phage-related tail fiber protein
MMPRKEIIPAVNAHEARNAETVGGFTPGQLMPVGAILPFAGSSPPPGWLLCNGDEVSRSAYANLFAVIGEYWGQGDDSTTFNIPDLRGRFLRGVDGGIGRDPDRSSRGADYPGGNTGDNVGSVQSDATALPRDTNFSAIGPGTHTHETDVEPDHTHPFTTRTDTGNYEPARGSGGYLQPGANTWPAGQHSHEIPESGSHGHDITGGDNETRAKNAYVHWIIKY